MAITLAAAVLCSALGMALCGATFAARADAQNVFGVPASTTGAAKATHASGKGGGLSPAKTAHGAGAVKTTPASKVKIAPAGNAATTATTATTAAETGGGVNSSLVAALALAVVLLGGIAFVIVRNARSVAPVVEGLVTGGTRNPEGKLHKRRAQAKAAKRQRKRHRKR